MLIYLKRFALVKILEKFLIVLVRSKEGKIPVGVTRAIFI